MRRTTLRANKVKQMLYSNFKGNKHTGLENEDSASQAFTTYMQQNTVISKLHLVVLSSTVKILGWLQPLLAEFTTHNFPNHMI